MGRELKRVALDFNWPLEKVWPGFVMPDHSEGNRSDCPDCKQGYSPDAQFLHDQWYGNAPFDPSDTGSKPFTPDTPAVYAFAKRQIERSPEFYLPGLSQFERLYRGTTLGETIPLLLQQGILREAQRLCDLFNACWSHHLDAHDVKALVDADRLWDFTRVSRTPEQRAIVEIRVAGGNNSWLPGPNGYLPTPEEVNTWSISGFGHDSINCGVCIKAKAERLGFAYLCPTCDGHCSVWTSPEAKAAAEAADEAWEKTEPPAGEGWQLWETVTEGSPVSPVFASAHQLIDFLVKHEGYSLDAAQNFVHGSGWAMSGMSIGGTFYKDIEACGHHATLALPAGDSNA